MSDRAEYKTTLFDRHGPDGVLLLRTWAYGLMIFGLVFGVVLLRTGFHWWTLPVCIVVGAAGSGLAYYLSNLIGGTYRHFMVDGSSTPYREQYSYQQALVMQGRLEEALASFEEVIAADPANVDGRVRAAELYDRERKDHARAAALFREVRGIAGISAGEDIYASQRLVDLYMDKLDQPGKAMGELRRIIDRYPGTPAATNARSALAELKRRHVVVPTPDRE